MACSAPQLEWVKIHWPDIQVSHYRPSKDDLPRRVYHFWSGAFSHNWLGTQSGCEISTPCNGGHPAELDLELYLPDHMSRSQERLYQVVEFFNQKKNRELNSITKQEMQELQTLSDNNETYVYTVL